MFRLFTIALSATALLNSCGLISAPRPGSPGFSVEKDITFTPRDWPQPLVATVYKPVSAAPAPAVLLIHGGGWTGKERRSDMTAIAKDLAKRGYFVMNTTYRLTPGYKFPAQTQDIDQALRYMRANSAALNLDPERIATFGYSAGGHLAALAGLDPKNDIKAIVAGGTPSDMSFWPDGKLTGLLLGGPLKGNEAIYKKASPVTYVTKNSPPVFIYHGTKDTLVPIEHPKAFIQRLEENKVPHETYWIQGRNHIPAHLFPAQATSKAIDFLDKYLKTGS